MKTTDPGERRTQTLGCLCVLLCGLSGFLCSSCGDPNDFSEVGPPPSRVQVVLTQENHEEGWGLAECLLCHPIFKIHQKSSDPNLDLEEIRRFVEQRGQASCTFCHGGNGA